MIISRTPLRISFLGGGSDYPTWYRRHGGIVVGGAINQYVYVTARFLPSYHRFKTRVAYSKIEEVARNDQIEHPAVRGVLKYLNLDREDSPGLEIAHMSDLPGRTGTGSSSAFSVGLLHALRKLCRQQWRTTSKDRLAADAIHVEQNLLGETVGSQDQSFAAHGGINVIDFYTDGRIEVRPVFHEYDLTGPLDLRDHLMLFYTGISRTASEVAASYVPALPNKEVAMGRMMELTEKGVEALRRGNYGDLGRLMDESWVIKRNLSPKVTTPDINHYYHAALEAGAWGGKLLGAGGGGCLLLVVDPKNQPAVAGALASLVRVRFDFDFSGSRIIFNGDC